MDTSYFCHKSHGVIQFDPGKGTKYFDPNWALLICDSGIIDLYCWYALKYGVQIIKNKQWGAHISFVKGDTPNDKWGYCDGQKVEFFYSNQIRYDNGCHAWLDCWSPALHEIRQELGLPVKTNMSFHLTLGRLAMRRENVKVHVESEY